MLLSNYKNVRYDEAGEKTRLRMTNVRVETDAVYKTMIENGNVLIIVNGEVPYADFVNKLNVRIAAYTNNFSINSRKS